MVAIPTARVARYVQKPDTNLIGFLLHGTDAGLVREYGVLLSQQMVAALPGDPEIIRLSDDDLAHDPDRLAIEAQTVSMFSPSKVLRIRAGARATAELVKFPWDRLPDGVRVVVEAGNLKKDVKLRKLFETAKTLAALPCHDGNDTANISQLVRSEISAAQIAIEKDAERHLTGLLGADIGVAKSEIAKLVTYAGTAGRITVEDVDAVIGDTSQGTLDAAVDAILARNAARALYQMEKLRASGTPADVVLSALLQHLMRLLRLSAKIDEGASADAAIRTFRPPLHFKRADQMKHQIRNWNRPQLKRALLLTSLAVKQTRTNQTIAHQIAADTIIRLSHGTQVVAPRNR